MKKALLGITIIMFLIITCLQAVMAASNAELEKRIKELENPSESNSDTLAKIADRLTFSGSVEIDLSYSDDSDISDNAINSSLSDIEVGTIELGVEAILHDYVTANLLLKGEELDSDPTVFWDEAFFTIQKEGFPLYFVGGKRGLPFGSFENQLINDPITCELYEISDTGVTIGVIFDTLDINFSTTVYKGEVLMDTVSNAGYGFERNNTPGYTADDKIKSYIINFSMTPIEDLTIAAYFNSETGDDERNTTAGLSLHYEPFQFIIDSEYITALNREKHFADDKEYNESAWFFSLGYQIMEPLIAAVRYESFDDDKKGGQDTHLAYRYSLGATYTLFTKKSFVCNLSLEYRKSEFEHTAGSNADNNLDELFAQLAIEF